MGPLGTRWIKLEVSAYSLGDGFGYPGYELEPGEQVLGRLTGDGVFGGVR